MIGQNDKLIFYLKFYWFKVAPNKDYVWDKKECLKNIRNISVHTYKQIIIIES